MGIIRSNQRQEIDGILQNAALIKDMEILPSNYTFEIPKTIWKIRATGARIIALQFPEGLTMYACIISDILERHAEVEVIILGDVTYGACCVDDFTAKALGCDLLVHYGHSCLVPIQDTVGIHLLYVFVNIDINVSYFVEALRQNFKKEHYLGLVSTIQFAASLQAVKKELSKDGYNIAVPQNNPLSPGELLGCTAPLMPLNTSALIYLGDGRFHLESVMIQNPKVPAYQYNPYSCELTREHYGFEQMINTRKTAIDVAYESEKFGLILGTLGRQGNLKIFEHIERQLSACGKRAIKILLSEVYPDKLALFTNVQCWIQVACPRLSIDWGHNFTNAPLLTPYEFFVAMNLAKFDHGSYPMDYYAYDSNGAWTNNHESYRPKRRKACREHISLKSHG